MAVEAQMKDDQEQDKGFGQQTDTNPQDKIPTLGGQQSTVLGTSTKPTNPQVQQAGQSTTQQKGSGMGARLTNLRKYIDTNRNAGMAQGIQKGMENIRSGVQQGIGQAQTKLQEQVGGEKSRLQAGEKLVQGTQQGGLGVFEKGRSEAFTGQKLPEQAQAPDFSAYGQTAQERLGAFGKYRQGEAQQFDIENQAQLENQAQELQKRANLSQSEAGRYQLLRETFNRPAYTTGQQRLDQLILQAAPEESQRLQTMAQEINKPVQAQLSALQAQKEAENKAILEQAQGLQKNIATQLYGEAGQPTIDYTSGQIKDVGQGVLGQFQTELEEARTKAATDIGTQYAQIQDKIKRGENLTADELSKLGITGEDAQSFLDYYKKGQKATLGETVAAGQPLSDFQIGELSKAIPSLTPETIKNIQNQQPMDINTFAANRGMTVENGRIGKRENINTGKKTSSGTGKGLHSIYKEVFIPDQGALAEYNQYVSNVAQNKQNLKNLIQEAVGFDQIANIREAPTLDFSKYLSSLKGEDIQVGQVASAEDYARQQALRDLSALQFGPLTDATQAGTIGQVGVGRFDLQNALGQAREYYNPAEYSKMGRVSAPSVDSEGFKTDDTLQSGVKSIDDILKGNVGTGAQGIVDTGINLTYLPVAPLADLDKLITGGNTINSLYNKTKEAVDYVFSPGDWSFFCTHIYKLGLVSKSDFLKLQKFLSQVQFSQAPFLSWYIDNGPEIVESANFFGFDWKLGKEKLFDSLIPLFEKGDIEGAVKCYDSFVVDICHFVGKSVPYYTRNPKFLDCVLSYPKVLLFYTKLKLKRFICKI